MRISNEETVRLPIKLVELSRNCAGLQHIAFSCLA